MWGGVAAVRIMRKVRCICGIWIERRLVRVRPSTTLLLMLKVLDESTASFYAEDTKLKHLLPLCTSKASKLTLLMLKTPLLMFKKSLLTTPRASAANRYSHLTTLNVSSV